MDIFRSRWNQEQLNRDEKINQSQPAEQKNFQSQSGEQKINQSRSCKQLFQQFHINKKFPQKIPPIQNSVKNSHESRHPVQAGFRHAEQKLNKGVVTKQKEKGGFVAAHQNQLQPTVHVDFSEKQVSFILAKETIRFFF